MNTKSTKRATREKPGKLTLKKETVRDLAPDSKRMSLVRGGNGLTKGGAGASKAGCGAPNGGL